MCFEKIKKIKNAVEKLHFRARKMYMGKMAAMSCGMAVFMDSITASANGNEWDFLTDGPQENDPFGNITSAIKDIFSSFYQMVFVSAISWIAVALLLIALAFTKKNSNAREEAKDRFVWLIVAGLIVFGMSAILSTIQMLALGIQDAVKV